MKRTAQFLIVAWTLVGFCVSAYGNGRCPPNCRNRGGGTRGWRNPYRSGNRGNTRQDIARNQGREDVLLGQLEELKDKMRDKLNSQNPDWRSIYNDWMRVRDLPHSNPEWQKARDKWRPIYEVVRADVKVKRELQDAIRGIRDTIKQLQDDLAKNPPSTNTAGTGGGSNPGTGGSSNPGTGGGSNPGSGGSTAGTGGGSNPGTGGGSNPGTGGGSNPGATLPPMVQEVLKDALEAMDNPGGVLEGLKGSDTEVTPEGAQEALDALGKIQNLPPELKTKLGDFQKKLDKYKDKFKGVKVTVGDLANYYQETSKAGGEASIGGFLKWYAVKNPGGALKNFAKNPSGFIEAGIDMWLSK